MGAMAGYTPVIRRLYIAAERGKFKRTRATARRVAKMDVENQGARRTRQRPRFVSSPANTPSKRSRRSLRSWTTQSADSGPHIGSDRHPRPRPRQARPSSRPDNARKTARRADERRADADHQRRPGPGGLRNALNVRPCNEEIASARRKALDDCLCSTRCRVSAHRKRHRAAFRDVGGPMPSRS
jgi:hypothetical protein